MILVELPWSIRTLVGLVDGHGLNLRAFIHYHDLSAFNHCGVRHGKLLDGRI